MPHCASSPPPKRCLRILSPALSRRSRAWVVSIAAAGAVLLTHLGLQIRAAERIETSQARNNTWIVQIVERLEDAGVTSPCLMYGMNSPMLSYPLGCRAVFPTLDNYAAAEPQFAATARAEGKMVIVVAELTSLPEDSYLRRVAAGEPSRIATLRLPRPSLGQ